MSNKIRKDRVLVIEILPAIGTRFLGGTGFLLINNKNLSFQSQVFLIDGCGERSPRGRRWVRRDTGQLW